MRLRALTVALLGALLWTAGLVTPAAAQIEVDVNRGDIQPLPVAVPGFRGERGAEIAQVITSNLERSGLFRPIDPAAFIEQDLDIRYQPRFADWK